MKNFKKVVAVFIATVFVFAVGAVSAFAITSFSTTGSGYGFSGSISGNIYGASAVTNYNAPSNIALCSFFLEL